jgi:hypothetical protein
LDLKFRYSVVRYLVVSVKMFMGRFVNVYPNIMIANLYSAVLCLCRELTQE